MSDIVLQTNHLSKRYGDTLALDDVNITLKQKHIYGFIGKNGAGKTTLMKILTGLSYPESGDFSLFGEREQKKITQLRRYIGSTIEAPALYSEYTVYRNLELQRLLAGNPDRNICDTVLELMRMTEIRNKRVRNLSMGMKQRLSVALALVGNPRILILDEPINGLDPQNIVALRDLLKKLSEERNITQLISSHILGELYMLATDYIIIDNGKIIDILTHEELEEKCRKYINITTDSVPFAVTVLEKEFKTPEYKVVSDKTIHLYSDTEDMQRIAEILMKNGITVTEFFTSKQTLEEYFLSITGDEEGGRL